MPFALGALGTAGSGLAHLLGPLRPFITALSVGLLGLAFYQTYRRSAASCAQGGDCDRPAGATRRLGFLWTAASVTLVLVTVPYWLDWVIYWSL